MKEVQLGDEAGDGVGLGVAVVNMGMTEPGHGGDGLLRLNTDEINNYNRGISRCVGCQEAHRQGLSLWRRGSKISMSCSLE